MGLAGTTYASKCGAWSVSGLKRRTLRVTSMLSFQLAARHAAVVLPAGQPSVLSLHGFVSRHDDRLVAELDPAVGPPRQGVLEPLLVVAGGEVLPVVAAAALLAGAGGDHQRLRQVEQEAELD